MKWEWTDTCRNLWIGAIWELCWNYAKWFEIQYSYQKEGSCVRQVGQFIFIIIHLARQNLWNLWFLLLNPYTGRLHDGYWFLLNDLYNSILLFCQSQFRLHFHVQGLGADAAFLHLAFKVAHSGRLEPFRNKEPWATLRLQVND